MKESYEWLLSLSAKFPKKIFSSSINSWIRTPMMNIFKPFISLTEQFLQSGITPGVSLRELTPSSPLGLGRNADWVWDDHINPDEWSAVSDYTYRLQVAQWGHQLSMWHQSQGDNSPVHWAARISHTATPGFPHWFSQTEQQTTCCTETRSLSLSAVHVSLQ